jgi:hypothetical protein
MGYSVFKSGRTSSALGGVRFNCLLPNRNHEDFSFGLSDIGKTVFIDMKNAPTQ